MQTYKHHINWTKLVWALLNWTNTWAFPDIINRTAEVEYAKLNFFLQETVLHTRSLWLRPSMIRLSTEA